MRWKLTLEYDGGGFCGWQRQENAPSVQQCLEEAIERFCGEVVRVHTAGRTDTGVHALGQVAHFDMMRNATSEEVQGAINFYTRPHPVGVIKAESVGEDFHARFSARSRSYVYRIVNRCAPLVLESGRAWLIHHPLDDVAMGEAARMLIGKHDFSTFRAKGCQASGPIKTLDKIDVVRCGDDIHITTSARSFLYHQVRNMVGTLAMVGLGRWTMDDFAQAFAACDRTKGGPTAPPQGLYFIAPSYDD